MIASVSAVDCSESEVAVDKLESGNQECIPQPPSPMNDLEQFWVEEAIDSIAEEFYSYFDSTPISSPS